jgi:large subunit ribosomal protein L23
MDYLSSIIQPIVTEKSTAHNAQNKYMFKVRRDADKGTIRKAFEELYGVKAVSIHTHILPKKERMIRRGKLWAKRPVAKRAIITIEKGKTIDPNKLKK